MIEILASAPDTSYISLFDGDWIVFGLIGGLIWALKDNFNFGRKNQEDYDEHDYY